MSTYESDGWNVGETIAFISILQSIKDSTGSSKLRELDWPYVAKQMAQNKFEQNRSISELLERYKKLRTDYFTAVYRNRSCHFFNYLKNLLDDEEEDALEDYVQPEEEQEEHIEVEPKYAHTLDEDDRPLEQPYRCKWVEGEVEAFLNTLTTLKLQTALTAPRNAKVFKLVSREMAKRNFIKRPDQLRVKYHMLRRQYAKAKRGGERFEHYEDMHALLNGTQQHGESSGVEFDSEEEEQEEGGGGDVALETESESEDALPGAEAMPPNVRVRWADGEVDVLLDIIKSMGLETALLRKRNAKVFKLLSKEMAKRSYEKGAEKIRIKFQQLRRQYNKAQRGGESFEHYETMHQLLNPAKNETNLSSGSDSESLCSIDDDEAEIHQRDADKYFWTDHEVDAFLAIIKQHNLFHALDGSKKRNFKTLAQISSIMAKQSFQRTGHQLRNKLRLLLRRYREAQRMGVKNVRILPRHYDMLDELLQKKKHTKPKKTLPPPPPETESEGSASSCDLMRGESEDLENTFEVARELTPLEVLNSISEGQKELISTLNDSHERFLQQQREMQREFLQDLSDVMRQEREATFRMLRELIQPKT